MRRSCFLTLFSFLIATSTFATVWPSDGTTANVQSLHDNSAQNGDTITLPAGTFTWSQTITITKAITLQGGGIGNTIIRDAGSGNLINWWLVAGNPARLTGVEFRDGGRTVMAWGVNTFGSNTNGSTMRVDHCKFDHLIGFAIGPTDTIGVIDHNTFLVAPTNIPIYAMHRNWNDGGPFSGGSWHDASHFGTSQFLFIEDNSFTYDDTPYAAFDCYGGARVVLRYNSFTRAHIEIHGTDSAGIVRGGRAFEIYNNTFNGPTGGNYVINGRSGIFIVHDNQTTGITDAKLQLVYYRANFAYLPWGAMDGTNPWDLNVNSVTVQAIDQPGRSQGSLLSQVDPPYPPIGWNDQITEPSYEWNNTQTEGGSFHFACDPYCSLIRVGEHYFNTTVAPGYAPYIYPHPLVTGGSPSPTPTSTPSVTATPTVTPTATVQPSPSPTVTATPTPGQIVLSVTRLTLNPGNWHFANLTWSGTVATRVDIFSDGIWRAAVENDTFFQYSCGQVSGARTWKVCVADTNICSNSVHK